jgi:hypothetical protein
MVFSLKAGLASFQFSTASRHDSGFTYSGKTFYVFTVRNRSNNNAIQTAFSLMACFSMDIGSVGHLHIMFLLLLLPGPQHRHLI